MFTMTHASFPKNVLTSYAGKIVVDQSDCKSVNLRNMGNFAYKGQVPRAGYLNSIVEREPAEMSDKSGTACPIGLK